MARTTTKKTPVAASIQLPAEYVGEVELAAYLTDLKKVKALKSQLKDLESKVDGQKEAFLAKLQRGVPVLGRILAKFELKDPACRPAWKSEFENLSIRLGLNPKEEVEAVQELTRAKLVPEPVLVVADARP